MVAAFAANLKQKFRFLSIVSQHSQPPPRRIAAPARAHPHQSQAHPHQSQARKKARTQASGPITLPKIHLLFWWS
jgi:hypothetical protein